MCRFSAPVLPPRIRWAANQRSPAPRSVCRPVRRKLPIERQPSDYFYDQVYTTFFNDAVGGQLLSSWGQDNCLWSNDYPHGNSPWPRSMDVLDRNLGHLAPEVVHKLVQQNVVKLYGLNLG